MPQFVIGFMLGMGLTMGVLEMKNAPKEPVCTMESGDSFWTRKKQEVPCAKEHPHD